MEEGPTERVLFAPEAQYTRDLLAAIPHPTFEPEHADPAPGGGRETDAAVHEKASRPTAQEPHWRRKAEADPLDDFIAAGARALDLKIDKAWMPAVRSNLAVTLPRLAALVPPFALPDDAEPAPVFKA